MIDLIDCSFMLFVYFFSIFGSCHKIASSEMIIEPTNTTSYNATKIEVKISVQVIPEDAQIEAQFSDGSILNWHIGEQNVETGIWKLHVSRKGWESQDITLDITEEPTTVQIELQSQIHEIHIATHPTDTKIQIFRENHILYEFTGTTQTQFPAGQIRIQGQYPKYPPKNKEILLDEQKHVFVCLDVLDYLLQCERKISVGKAPKSVLFSPDGSQIWTALLSGPPSVQAYDVQTGEQIASIDLGNHGAVELEFSQDGKFIWASQMNTSSVYEIDTESFEVTRQMKTKSAWSKIVERSFDGKHLYVSNWVGDDVSEIDLATGTVSRKFKTHDTPRGVWATRDGKYLYVSSFDDGTVQRFDLATGIPTTIFEGAKAARHIVVDEESQRMYISDLRNKRIWVVNLHSNEKSILAYVESNPNTIVLSPDKKILFVSCRGQNNPENYTKKGPDYGTIFVLNAWTGTILDVIVGGNQPTGLSIDPQGKLLAFSDFQDHQISIYKIPSTEILLQGRPSEEINKYKIYKNKTTYQ